MFWGFSLEAWTEWCRENGLDPNDFTGTMAKIQEPPKFICEKCDQPIDADKVYVHLEPPPPLIAPKFLHWPCFVQHVEEHGEDISDPIMCYVYRKKI